MAKRRTGIGKNKKSRSHKTAKRLAIKRLVLEEKANKKSVNKVFCLVSLSTTLNKWYEMVKQIPENKGEPCKGAILITINKIKKSA